MCPPQSLFHSLCRALNSVVRCERGALFATIVACTLLLTPAGFGQESTQSQPAAPPKRSGAPLAGHLSKFYDAPNPLPPGKPGELIRAKPADDFYLSADFSAFRILYHSRSVSGQDVAVSGVVLVPDGTTPTGGWPVIAWAHGFNGVGRQCAPSLLRNLYYGPFLSMYINLGYAVVATDYAGLGTDFRSAVLDAPSDATDVIYSIPAARAAVPQLGPRWVAMGSSLGANVTIGVAEMESRTRDPSYLGGVAISGVADLKDVYERLPKEQASRMLEFLAYSVKTVYPDFDVRDMLTEKGLAAYQQINQSCGSVGSSGAQGPASEPLKQNWKNSKFVEEFFERNSLGRAPAYGPLLVISDDGDPGTEPSISAQAVARMCKQGDRIQFNSFSSSQPGLVIGDSVREQMSWIEARFSGRPAPTNCP